MSPDTFEIAKAISSLKDESSILKDYIFPLISTIVTVFLGYKLAERSFNHQEKIKSEIAKVNSYNRFFVGLDAVFQTLIAIKRIYAAKIDSDPLNRALYIPKMVGHVFDPPDVNSISFLSEKNEYYGALKIYDGWSNLARLNTMVGNYARLQNVIVTRNNQKDIVNAILKETIPVNGQIDILKAFEKNPSELAKLIDATESMISLVDSLIREVYSCLTELSDDVSKIINTKLIEGHVNILTYKNISEELMLLLHFSPQFSAYNLVGLLGMNEYEIVSLYKTGYEDMKYKFMDYPEYTKIKPKNS
ncbi:TPA: hypothetical protein OMS29_004257 [Klebsiella aerogenes]|nr:hypothetical protein [Klebsiella aerogenes]